MKICIPKDKHTSLQPRRLLLKAVPLPYFYLKKRKVVVTGKILTPVSALEAFKEDKDISGDLNKFGGINLRFFSEADINSAMLSFLPDFNSYRWEIRPYGNINGSFEHGWLGSDRTILVREGQQFRATFELLNRSSVEVSVETFSSPLAPTYAGHNIFTYDHEARLLGLIGPWWGGKDDDKNQIGGVAPVEICLEASYAIKKK